MAKISTSATLKGVLTIDWALGELIVTTSSKQGEFEYSLAEILDRFNGKTVSISITENDTITPIGEYNVSSDTDGEEEEDYYKED